MVSLFHAFVAAAAIDASPAAFIDFRRQPPMIAAADAAAAIVAVSRHDAAFRRHRQMIRCRRLTLPPIAFAFFRFSAAISLFIIAAIFHCRHAADFRFIFTIIFDAFHASLFAIIDYAMPFHVSYAAFMPPRF